MARKKTLWTSNPLGRSVVPASMSKTQQAQKGGFGHGLGNNICQHERGFNAIEDKLNHTLDERAHYRREKYAHLRKTEQFKQALRVSKGRTHTNRIEAPERDVPGKKFDPSFFDWFVDYSNDRTPMSKNDYGLKYNKTRQKIEAQKQDTP